MGNLWKQRKTAVLEMKTADDFILDGNLAWGLSVGRFVFEKNHIVVYSLLNYDNDCTVDIDTYYQISKADYDMLLSLSVPKGGVPDPEVSIAITDPCKIKRICSRSEKFGPKSFSIADTEAEYIENN